MFVRVVVMIVAMIMGVRMRPTGFDRDEVVLRKPDAAFRLDVVGQRPDLLRRAFQHGGFKTGVVIQMDMHGRHDDIMMVVL